MRYRVISAEPRTSSVKTQSNCSGCQSPTMLLPTREKGISSSHSAARMLAECVPLKITPLGRYDDVRISGRLTLLKGAFRSERKETKCSAQSCPVQYPSAPRRILDWNSFTVSRFPKMNVMVRVLAADVRLTPRSRAAAGREPCSERATL